MDDTKALSLLRSACPSISATTTARSQKLQSLWAGMGAVYALTADDDCRTSVVAKVIALPEDTPSLSVGDRRKLESYHAEAAFYSQYAWRAAASGARVPRSLHETRSSDGRTLTIVMERLERVGRRVDPEEAAKWMDRFHAVSWGAERSAAAVAVGLQAQGTYWYFDTRVGEHAGISRSGLAGRVRAAAGAVDRRLKRDDMLPCVVHGDAKCANMLRDASSGELAFCDFQYAGRAACAKDLAYLLICALDGSAATEAAVLSIYTAELTRCLSRGASGTSATAAAAIGDSSMPPCAPPPTSAALQAALDLSYVDLYRWMLGWGEWGDSGSLRLKVMKVMDRIDGGVILDGGEQCSEEAYENAVRAAFPIPV